MNQNLLMELHTGQLAQREGWKPFPSAPALVPGSGCIRAGAQHTAVRTLPARTPHPSAVLLEEKAVLWAAAL